MPFYKSIILPILLSLAAGALLFFIAPDRGGSSDSYGVLITGADIPDRQIRDLLVRDGFPEPLSESSQWVFLDDFEGLEMVALDDYAVRLEPYDPRDDGYAAKLRSFFAAGGKRRLFIPLADSRRFRSRLAAALGDIPFSAFILKSPQSPLPLALLFAIAATLTLILAGGAPGSLFLLPLWILLCREGSTGFALSAVLALLAGTLRDPALELFVSRHYTTSRALLKDFAVSWVLALFFIVFYILIGIFGALSPLVLCLSLAAFAVLGALTLRIELALGLKRGHVRFVPIRISGHSRHSTPLPWLVLPFALASLGFLFLSDALNPGTDNIQAELADWEGVPLISPADYEDHIQFQRSFSYLPLADGEEAGRSYLSYELDGAGLIAGALDTAAEGPVDILPPFPLTELTAFLEGTSTGASNLSGSLLPALMVLGLSAPLFLGRLRGHRKKGKFSIYIDKRIAA
jgi:hypothetical protein